MPITQKQIDEVRKTFYDMCVVPTIPQSFMKFFTNIIRYLTNKPIKRSKNIMSKNNALQGKLDAVMVTLEDYINATVASALADSKTVSAKDVAAQVIADTKAPAPEKKETKAKAEKAEAKEDLTELSAEAKALAGKVMANIGKDKLTELLADVGAARFSDIKTATGFTKFVKDAKEALAAKPEEKADEDDLLGDESAPEAKERTLDDVKKKLLEVQNNEKLGRDTMRQLMSDFGAQRLPQVDPAKYSDLYAAAEKALKNVG